MGCRTFYTPSQRGYSPGTVGFDQIVISEVRDGVAVKMGDLQSIKHLAKYGRPMYVDFFLYGEVAYLRTLGGMRNTRRAKMMSKLDSPLISLYVKTL